MPLTPQSASTDPRANHVESPSALRHIPLTFDNSDPDPSALKLVQEFCPQWTTDDGPVEFVRFTDGITNTLLKAIKRRPGKTKSEVEQDAILVRAYGKGTDVLINRERELRAHNVLATFGLAPPLLARFDNGLMYRFIEGDVCTPEDLRRPEVYRQVAKRLGQWHGSLPVSVLTSTPPRDGEVNGTHCDAKKGKASRPWPNNWTVMQQWIDALPTTTDKETERRKTLAAELVELSTKFGDTPGLGGNDYIFGHCDLLSGNVIIKPLSDTHAKSNGDSSSERPVDFIDYEYATASAAAFDLANHFSEWAGFECDHGAVPTKSQRREFIKHYVTSFRLHSIPDGEQTIEIDFQKDIDQLYEQVDLFRGVPGFYWGIWALIQATISQIDFDYANYAELRLGEYWAWRAETDGSRVKSGQDLSPRERRWAEE